MEKTIRIANLSELSLLAATISAYAFPGFVLGLGGELGSGKTTFAQFFAKHLGVVDTVNSPTFTILKTYQGRLPFYHMDVYRLEAGNYDYELDDFIFGDGVAVIEWYEYIARQLPEQTIGNGFDGKCRRIAACFTLKGSGPYERIVEAIGH
ncbi:MAG: tRNA (adenosine(37)-N6)-threonylcarbamoyltransferase complex ATPase subunit type 1 TsaE [Bacillus subtilis]|nr:tRNA (adenosine(37)-N6)-threonylcarbamoyltransferase complex ATPase subunit type 1 TsaE [Bacillus subtilis]